MIARDAFDGICRAAGIDPNVVASIYADARHGVTFVVYMTDEDGKKYRDPVNGEIATAATFRHWVAL